MRCGLSVCTAGLPQSSRLFCGLPSYLIVDFLSEWAPFIPQVHAELCLAHHSQFSIRMSQGPISAIEQSEQSNNRTINPMVPLHIERSWPFSDSGLARARKSCTIMSLYSQMRGRCKPDRKTASYCVSRSDLRSGHPFCPLPSFITLHSSL